MKSSHGKTFSKGRWGGLTKPIDDDTDLLLEPVADDPETRAKNVTKPLIEDIRKQLASIDLMGMLKPIIRLSPSEYKCKVYLIPEEGGGFSIVAAQLPGVASQGDTEEEALDNIREAFEGVIQSYKANNQTIPWLEEPEQPEPGSKTLSVVVHA